MGREPLGQFGLSAGPQVVPELRPRLQPGPVDQPEEVGPHAARRIPSAGNDGLGSLRGLLKNLHKRPTRLGRQRIGPAVITPIVLGLAGEHVDALSAAIDVASGQGQVHTGGASHSAAAAHHAEQPPANRQIAPARRSCCGHRPIQQDPRGVQKTGERLPESHGPDPVL